MVIAKNTQERLRKDFGDWAVVTGATSGIGLALATQLAHAGFNLIISARSVDALADMARDFAARYNIQIRAVEADLSKPDGVEKIIAATHGLRVGLLINNAGFGTSGSFVDSFQQTEIDMLRVNCEAVLSLTHYFARHFKQQRRGGIIFLSSLVAFQGVPFAAHYAATKAYVQSLSEALAIELKPMGVSVLVASPGPVETNFGKRANMRMGKSLTPAQVAVPILTALGKQTHVIPGWLSKVLIYALRTAPRFIKVRIMQQVMGGFTKHQRT